MKGGGIKLYPGAGRQQEGLHIFGVVSKVLFDVLLHAKQQNQVGDGDVQFRTSVIFQCIEQVVGTIAETDLNGKLSEKPVLQLFGH